MADAFTAIGTVAAVFDLAKVAWKLGSALVKLAQDTKCVDTTVENLAGEVKSLSDECKLIHSQLEKVLRPSKSETSSPYDVYDHLWNSLTTRTKECSRILQELGVLVREVADRSDGFVGQTQRQMKLNKNRENFENIRVRLRTHTHGLRTTLVLINIEVSHIAPGHANKELSQKLDILQDMVHTLLQNSVETTSRESLSSADTTLVQCAREVMVTGTTMYEASVAGSSVFGGQGAANSNTRVALWITTLDAIRREEPAYDQQSEAGSARRSTSSGDEGRTSLTGGSLVHHDMPEYEAKDDSLVDDDSDDELAVDLARTALETGNEAFGAAAWQEADSLFQETVVLLQQLPKGQRGFCDTFELQYKLAVCAYHTQEPADAEGALTSLYQQEVGSDQHRRYVCDVAHLLSLLYIRMDKIEQARSECEKALQARRRLLGKDHDASLESTALMAVIYQSLQSRALSKVYLTMIPESRKLDILRKIDDSLGASLSTDESISSLHRLPSEDSTTAGGLNQPNLTRSNPDATTVTRVIVTPGVPKSGPAVDPDNIASRESKGGTQPLTEGRPNRKASEKQAPDKPRYTFLGHSMMDKLNPPMGVTIDHVPKNLDMIAGPSKVALSESTKHEPPHKGSSGTYLITTGMNDNNSMESLSLSMHAMRLKEQLCAEEEELRRIKMQREINRKRLELFAQESRSKEALNDQTATGRSPIGFTRNQIIDNLSFNPQTPIEVAICRGSSVQYIITLLKTDQLSKIPVVRGSSFFRKGRASPLHYAALFGDVEIARQILTVNREYLDVDILDGFALQRGTPFTWAFLARQADMLNLFLTTKRNVTTALASVAHAPQVSQEDLQWWLKRTISGAERLGTYIPKQFNAMVKVLLEFGWPIDKGIGTSGWTLLHYAVAYGIAYDPDGSMVTSLCEQGADPLKMNSGSVTPYMFALNDSNDVSMKILDKYIHETDKPLDTRTLGYSVADFKKIMRDRANMKLRSADTR